MPDRSPRAKGAPTALDGLLFVDFRRVVAGPAEHKINTYDMDVRGNEVYVRPQAPKTKEKEAA